MKFDITNYKIFTVLLAFIYILGIICAFYGCEILGFVLTFIILTLLISLYDYDFKKILVLAFLFIFALIRVYLYPKENFLSDIRDNSAKLYGQIVSSKDILTKNKRIRFYLKVSSINLHNRIYDDLDSKVLVNLDLDDKILNDFSIGDYIEVEGKLRPPSAASNPHQFDYKRYLINNNTYNILYGRGETLKKVKEAQFSKSFNDSWFYILKKFELMRSSIIKKHAKNIKSPELEILGGIVFGNETINPDEDTKENFKNSGLLHLLAASGLNVALIFGIWWWIGNLLRFPYHLSILLGALFVILYTFMTGFPPSILRASLMLLFVLFGKLINRSANSFALICFVALLILLFNPKMIFDIGFQLSFVVTIGLVTCCDTLVSKFDKADEKFRERYKNLSRFQKYFFFLLSPKSLACIVVVPLVAQIWVIPLQIHYFNNFAPLSIFANIAVVPFIGLLSFIGFVSSLFAIIPNISSGIIYVFDIIAKPFLIFLVKISEFFASFKISLLNVSGINVFQIFVYWTIVLLFILNLKNNFKNKKHLSILLGVSVIFLFSFINFHSFNKNLEIMMFDVGNADSFLIKTPNNKYILIDTGRKSYRGTTSGEIIINKYLKNERINKIKTLIITHFDSDHCGGAIDILEKEKVETIYIQKDEEKSLLSKEILDYLKDNKLNYKIAKDNEEIYKEKDLSLKTFKANYANDSNKDKVDNETSIITLLKYKDKNILFMADAGVFAFEQIEKHLPSKIDILKIGHHGALGVIDDKMLDRIKPDYALISTGVNKFNHPNPKTISLLYDKDIKIIISRNWGFSKIVLNENNFDIYHYDIFSKKLKKVLFEKEEINPLKKTKYFEEFLKKNL